MDDSTSRLSRQMIRRMAGPHGHRWFNRGLAVVLVGVALLLALRWLPVVEMFFEGKQVLAEMGFLGLLLYVVLFTLVSVLLMPRAIMSFSAGALFGLGWGFGTAIVGATLGACAAFLVCRFAVRKPVERLLEESERFALLDRAVARQGFKMVLLTRLSPVFPANLMNYAYGVMTLRLRDYAFATALGMMPTTFVSVALGAAAAQAAVGEEPDLGNVQLLVTLIALGATAVVSVVLARIARSMLVRETNAPVLLED